ncbi:MULTISPECIES: hypothetical protein [unclassified Pseudomonas]|uniref:hypothetical protein n=2 Tax=Pseudomonas TaxID=286 RepID=UPI0011AF695B|nr:MULTISPECIES: hypothetical protein [unclassified Pseudomonas]
MSIGVVTSIFGVYPENVWIVTNNFGGASFLGAILQDEERNMFSHEGPAIELLLFVFGLAGVLLVAWFIHHQYERKNGKGVKKQQNRSEGRST